MKEVMDRARRAHRAAALAVVLAAGAPAAANDAQPAPLFDDLGNHHAPVTTTSPAAQRYFDQGLMLNYGFNHAEAVRSFRAAQTLDPRCAMCFWGEALALGPNINKPMDPADAPAADAAVRTAQALAAHASARERAMIDALARRYSPDPAADRAPLDQAYADAMAGVVRDFPADLDAAALYAEALMDLMPWAYYHEDGSPKPLTDTVIATLESILARAPDHPGALHLYIHAVEASATPGRAEAAADRLGTIAPGAGHLVHMPAHIYLRIGRYHDASEANVRAALADESFISQCRAQGFYPALYYPHNVHFLWYTASLEGRSAVAMDTARKLADKVPVDLIDDIPLIEQFLAVPLYGLIRFARWDDVLAEPAPRPSHRFASAMWHAARATAYAVKGSNAEAQAEREQFRQAAALYGADAYEKYGYPADTLLSIAGHILEAAVAAGRGDDTALVDELERAVAAEDSLPYMEPPYWFFPVRQLLGTALLERGRAAEAEAVFRADLDKVPLNGWSLNGLARSLAAQGKSEAAAAATEALGQAWQRADVTPGADGLRYF